MTRDDYNWLKSALAVYTTQITLQSFNLPAEDRHEIVKSFLRKANDEISNKAIKQFHPQADTDFNQVITDFVLNTSFQESKQVFHTNLSKAVASFKESVLSSSTPLSDKGASLPITARFTHLPIEVNHPTSSILSTQSTLSEARNGTEFPTLKAPTSESWQPSIPLISGLGAAVIGIGAAMLVYCHKKRKSVMPRDSEHTHGLLDSVVSTQPERVPLTTLFANDNGRVSQDCATTRHLASQSRNGKAIKVIFLASKVCHYSLIKRQTDQLLFFRLNIKNQLILLFLYHGQLTLLAYDGINTKKKSKNILKL